jgi:Tfp pilus assembly protein PilX
MKKQKGFVVLLSSVVLMLIISLGAFIGAKGSILEQQTANAMYRTEEAFQYAEAGMREMWALLKLDPSKAASNQSITVAGKYTAAYNATTATITSTGTGSGNATRTVTQRILTTPGTGGGPAAMTALGYIELTGSASATDVKAGGTFSGNRTYKDAKNVTQNTSITQNSTEFQIALLDHNDQNLVDSSGKIITRSMTTDEYFMYFFGSLCPNSKSKNNSKGCKQEARDSVKANTNGYFCEKDCASDTEDEKLTNAHKSGKRIFWLDSGGIDHEQNMGTESDPVLIFVMNIADGSKAAKINANSTIYGILYVDVASYQTTLTCSCKVKASVSGISGRGSNAIYTWTKDEKFIELNSEQPPICSHELCTDTYKYKSPTFSCSTQTNDVKIGTVGACSFPATAVSGSNNTPVQIEVVGTWTGSGTGNTVIQGAAITSGNYEGQGNVSFIKNSTAITNLVLNGIGGAAFQSAPPTVSLAPNGWSDLN